MQKLGSMPDPELQPSASHACSRNFKQDSVAHLVATVCQGLAKDADSQAPPPLPQLESRHLASAQVILRRTHCSMRMSCRKKSASTDWPPMIASLKNNRRHSLAWTQPLSPLLTHQPQLVSPRGAPAAGLGQDVCGAQATTFSPQGNNPKLLAFSWADILQSSAPISSAKKYSIFLSLLRHH